MSENMKAFLDAIHNNEELIRKFEEISDKGQTEGKDYTDEVIALAKETGITLTKEDFELDEGELSDEELKEVSGGTFTYSPKESKEMAEFIQKMRDLDKKSEEHSRTTGDQSE